MSTALMSKMPRITLNKLSNRTLRNAEVDFDYITKGRSDFFGDQNKNKLMHESLFPNTTKNRLKETLFSRRKITLPSN